MPFSNFNLLMNVRFSVAGCKSKHTFYNHQIYFNKNLIFFENKPPNTICNLNLVNNGLQTY